MLIIDLSTGTVLTAHTCVLVDQDCRSQQFWDDFDNASDSEAIAVGRELGRPILPDSQALDAVAELLSAADWSSEHIAAVADMVRATGRSIEDV
jgi:hypothetical protein